MSAVVVTDSTCLIGLERAGELLLRAKKRGIIAVVRPVLDKLAANGFHASDELRERILKLAGE